MAEQQFPPLPENVTAEAFFEQLLPLGFAAQPDAAKAPAITLQYHLVGDGGGDWIVRIGDGQMKVEKGKTEAPLTFTLATSDWRDCVLARNGCSLNLMLPQGRPGRPENASRVNALKGTMALELSRDGADPFKLDMCFNNGASPRVVMKMKIQDYLDMQTGKLNGQEAFMTGKMRVEGDLPFLMQIATLTQ